MVVELKIYLAGSFVHQERLHPYVSKLWSLGHEVTSSWLSETTKPEGMDSDDFKRKLAIKDIAEVTRADLIILDNEISSGGKNVEWGVSLGQFQHKQLWLVGEPTNVFQYLADIQFANWDEVLEHLEHLKNANL